MRVSLVHLTRKSCGGILLEFRESLRKGFQRFSEVFRGFRGLYRGFRGFQRFFRGRLRGRFPSQSCCPLLVLPLNVRLIGRLLLYTSGVGRRCPF